MKLSIKLFIFIASLFPLASLAEESYEVGPDTYKKNPKYDDWNYLVAFPMIWAPSINGEIESDGERMDIEVPFSDIFDSLNFGLIGELYAQKGNWLYSLRLDFMHTSSENDTEGLKGPITGGVIAPGHRIETTIQMAANDLLVGYEVTPGLRLLTGVRHIYAQVDLDISPLSDDGFIKVDRSMQLSKTNDFDWLVGMTYRHWFTDDWGIAASVDTKIYGDNDRDRGFNAQAIYRFGGLHNVWIGYRFLQIGNDSIENGIKTKVDFIQQGPQLGWAFTF